MPVARIALLTDRPAHPATRALIRVLAQSRHSSRVLFVEECRTWPAPQRFDLVLERILDCRPDRWAIVLQWLDNAACVSDPLAAASAAYDKLAGGELMAEAGLQVPAFMTVAQAVAHPCPHTALGPPPWVAKPRRGSMGNGIHLANCVADGLTLEGVRGAEYLLQRRIKDPLCYRVLCSDDEVLASYTKVAAPGELVASVTLGARRGAIMSDKREEVEMFAKRMVLAIGGHIMGPDILQDVDGALWALECNTAPGFDHASDIAERWLRWLDRRLLGRAV